MASASSPIILREMRKSFTSIKCSKIALEKYLQM